MLSWSKKVMVALLLGVVVFTPWEILMAGLRIIEFTRVDFLRIAWWVPGAFALVSLLGFLLFNWVDHLLKVHPVYSPNALVFEYLLLSSIYLAIFFFRPYPYLLSLGLLGILLGRLVFFSVPFDYLYFLFGACLGSTVELVLTSLNLYLFSEPDFFGMPYWLPIFWGNAALALRRVAWILNFPGHSNELEKAQVSSQ